eukprot:TRINITY_DN3899_c0_g1_i3.p1 TRINITY_DN3899_c0_g1~~TRINITY_DN3899_c0_g1_i3.p1  ORF type:complete len:391 (+),score=72.02 TRINITY_DN3899_c0_g1_i3:165-1337(+)
MLALVRSPRLGNIDSLAGKSIFITKIKNENENQNQDEPQKWRSKGSAQLQRWARARSLRSANKPLENKATPDIPSVIPAINVPSTLFSNEEDEEEAEEVQGKAIYMVSDGTGWTAEHTVNAALGQFENCLVDRGCAVNTHLFSGIDDEGRLLEIIRQAAKEEALLLYTLADPLMADAAKRACQLWEVPYADILGPTTEAIGAHLGVAPSGVPRSSPSRKATLSKEYFKTIEAVEFTIKQDDGALPQNLHKADIVLVGVSRTSKTPLSMYLAQKGYKVANVPLVLGIGPPKELFAIDQDKIFALTINPVVLQAIRLARAKSLGLDQPRSSYSDMEHIRQELQHSNRIFANNPRWPVTDVTAKAVEETAAVILRIYHERKNKYAMPRISKRY